MVDTECSSRTATNGEAQTAVELRVRVDVYAKVIHGVRNCGFTSGLFDTIAEPANDGPDMAFGVT